MKSWEIVFTHEDGLSFIRTVHAKTWVGALQLALVREVEVSRDTVTNIKITDVCVDETQ